MSNESENPATPPEIHPKGWGHELWIVNNEKYCGKLLKFSEGKQCSWHYHKLKDETFWLSSGHMKIYFGNDDDISQATCIDFLPGDSLHVYPGLRHRMIAVKDSELFEFSTQHFETDSYRIEKGD